MGAMAAALKKEKDAQKQAISPDLPLAHHAPQTASIPRDLLRSPPISPQDGLGAAYAFSSSPELLRYRAAAGPTEARLPPCLPPPPPLPPWTVRSLRPLLRTSERRLGTHWTGEALWKACGGLRSPPPAAPKLRRSHLPPPGSATGGGSTLHLECADFANEKPAAVAAVAYLCAACPDLVPEGGAATDAARADRP